MTPKGQTSIALIPKIYAPPERTGQTSACPTCRQPVFTRENTLPKLSSRELEIVDLIQQAKTNKEIAFELRLTVGTVKEYVYHIFRKLGVTNRTELALWRRG